jgi:DNA-binding CsgD family transcriptional regulator
VGGGGQAAGVSTRAQADRSSGGTATDRELAVVAAVIAAGSEKAAAHRLGLSHSTVKHHLANARSKVGATTTAQLVWILAPRLPEPDGGARTDDGMPHADVPASGPEQNRRSPNGATRAAGLDETSYDSRDD